ncbi:MAG TPA: type II toxin-antitoxin system HicA family toxin [Candidatus Methanoperedenaceae archaeon]|nr:type II toxin-antitoxin system HicA family toxin [Candidatus Methanoperedenaceae archaeon]
MNKMGFIIVRQKGSHAYAKRGFNSYCSTT